MFSQTHLKVYPYDPFLSITKKTSGSSFIPTPPALAAKTAIINMRNDDEKCFMWAVLQVNTRLIVIVIVIVIVRPCIVESL